MKIDYKMLLRIPLSLGVMLCHTFVLLALSAFPAVPIIVIVSVLQLLLLPIFKVFNYAGVKIDNPDTFLNVSKYTSVNCLLGATVYLWIIPYTTYRFIKYGEL